jgi:hypothetical protein
MPQRSSGDSEARLHRLFLISVRRINMWKCGEPEFRSHRRLCRVEKTWMPGTRPDHDEQLSENLMSLLRRSGRVSLRRRGGPGRRCLRRGGGRGLRRRRRCLAERDR